MNSLEEELEIAKRVQEGLLSISHPLVAGVTLAKRCVPATSIGGDFYTFCYHEETVCSSQHTSPGIVQLTDSQETYLHLMIGDVAGHGVSSALVMALCMGLFNEISKKNRSCSRILQEVNALLYAYIKTSSIPYVTAVCLTYFPHARQLYWSHAGHPYPILMRGGHIIELKNEGLFLGSYPQESYATACQNIEPGDRLILYTDGIIECTNANGEALTIERMIEWCFLTQELDSQEAVSAVFGYIDDFLGTTPPKDDQSFIVVDFE